MTMKYTLGIDIGTSGTKTVLFDVQGKKLASSTVEYPLYQPKNGWAEQDPADWWNAVTQSAKAVMAESGVNPADVAGIGLSGQMHGLVMLDENNQVLRNSIIWCDGRTGEECVQIESIIGRKRLIEITANPALAGFTASKIMWVKNHEPEIWDKCRHILLPKDYIRFMLTGEYATEDQCHLIFAESQPVHGVDGFAALVLTEVLPVFVSVLHSQQSGIKFASILIFIYDITILFW